MSDTPIETPQEQTESSSEKPIESTEAEVPEKRWEGKLGPLDDINYHRMADTLDVDYEARKNPHIQEKIAFLTDWAAQETKSDDRLTQALAIKDLCKRLGYNITGKEMVTKLHRWAYLDMQRKRIELQQALV